MFRIVNGYVCTSGCDVAAAKRNADPRNPRNDPVKAAELADEKALRSGKPDAEASDVFKVSPAGAVSFGGVLDTRTNPGREAASAAQLVNKLA